MESVIAVSRDLCRAMEDLTFASPVTHVYNPLEYARLPHEQYLRRFARPSCEVLLIGMNPGPWGMAQTGVPFGEAAMVKEWMGISGRVDKPRNEHPKRPVLGLETPRSEVSGSRLWGWARERFGEADRFFARFFIWNYCPLAFLESSGKNRTPDKLPAAEREPLFAACDRGLASLIDTLDPQVVVGIGKFAADRIHAVLAPGTRRTGTILHPSPASPAANAGWSAKAEAQLAALGIRVP